MADVAAEIAAKLGISTAEFKASLADANASVKSFSEKGSHDAGSFTESIHGIHQSMRTFHQFMMAGGIVEVVKGFFEMAITAAENNKDANNENAEAVRQFGDTLKSMHGAIGEMAMNVVGFFNRIGAGIGTAMEATKDYFEASVLGNAANLAAFDQAQESEKAAAEQERTFALEKKLHGEDFKRINAEILSTQAAINAEKLKELSPAEKIVGLAEDRAKIEAELSSGTLSRVQVREHELELLHNEKDMLAAQAAIEQQQRADAIQRNKEQLDAQLKGLSLQQQIKLLNDDIRSGEVLITALKKQGVDVTVLEAEQKDLVTRLTKAQGEEEAKRLETKRKIAGSVQEELDLLTLQHKITLGIATGPEELRYQLILKQRQERELQIQIEQLGQKAIDDGNGKLSAADEKKLADLTKQKTKLDEQLSVIEEMINLPAVVSPPVAATLAAVAQTVAAIQKMNEGLKGAADMVISTFDGVLVGKPHTDSDYQNLSDQALQAIIAQNATKISQLEAGKGKEASSGAEAVTGYYTRSLAEGQIGLDTNAAQDVLKQRQLLRTPDMNEAMKAFVANGGNLMDFDSAYQNANSTAVANTNLTQINSSITSISRTLAHVFPSQSQGVTP